MDCFGVMHRYSSHTYLFTPLGDETDRRKQRLRNRPATKPPGPREYYLFRYLRSRGTHLRSGMEDAAAMDTDAQQCDVCGGIELIREPPVGQPRCERCATCVQKLKDSGGLVAGGGLREPDAFLVLATVAPDLWLPDKCAGIRDSAIGAARNGLGANPVGKAFRQWMTELLRAGFGDVRAIEGKQIKMTGVPLGEPRHSWRTYFEGVQLRHDVAKTNGSSEDLTIGGVPSPYPHVHLHISPDTPLLAVRLRHASARGETLGGKPGHRHGPLQQSVGGCATRVHRGHSALQGRCIVVSGRASNLCAGDTRPGS